MDEIRKLTYKEVILALIKQQNLHEGIWQLYIEFGIGAANMPMAEEKEDNLRLTPAAIVPVKTIGLFRVDKESPLALDASKVNPPITESNA